MIRNGGLLWLSFPASNFYHLSPEYYSSGYSTDIITKLCERLNLNVIYKDTLCNKRIYFYRHLLQIWPSSKEFFHPLLKLYGKEGTLMSKIFHQFKSIPIKLVIATSNKNFTSDLMFQIESIVLVQNFEE